MLSCVSGPILAAEGAAAEKLIPQTTPIVLTDQTGTVIRDLDFRGEAFARSEAAITLRNCRDVTITGCRFRNIDANAIRLFECKGIRIIDNRMTDLGDGKPKMAVYAFRCDGVLIESNRIERVESGAYLCECRGIRFIGNYVEDVRGPMPRGQMVQFDKVKGPGNEVSHNYALNHRTGARPEDMISMYKSHGTAESPILISHNYLMGDPKDGSAGKSGSGSGIMLGDGGGSHILCADNVLNAPGQVGIGVASGADITVRGNLVYGPKSDVSNVGIYVWNQYKEKGGDIRIVGNTVAWSNARGQHSSFWQGDANQGKQYEFTSVTVKDNHWDAWDYFQTHPQPADLDKLWREYRRKHASSQPATQPAK